MSLRMHPDKLNQRGQNVTDEDKEKFQRMKEAYDVLSDPQKRELYDQLGETGMKMMDDPIGATEDMGKNFLNMGTRDRLKLVLFVVAFVGAVLLFPILFCTKVDGDTSASWVAIWTPLWIYDAVGLWFFLYYISLGKVEAPEGLEDWEDPYPMYMRFLGLFKWLLLILFQIFLTLRLDGDTGWNWFGVFVPLFVWGGIRLCENIVKSLQKVPEEGESEGDSMLDEESGELPFDETKRAIAMAERNSARRSAIKHTLGLLQLALLALKLDDTIDVSWWLVFLPVWIFFILQVLSNEYNLSKAKSLIQDIDPDTTEISQEDKQKVMEASQLRAHVFSNCCCWVFSFTTFILAVAAITGADYSAFVIFIPSFIIAGCIVCCLSCVICFLRDDLDSGEEMSETEGNPESAGGSTNAPGNVSYGTYTPPTVTRKEGEEEDNAIPLQPAPAPAPAPAPVVPGSTAVPAPAPPASFTSAPSTHIDVDID
ncbi:unnamed protein product [Choristocarpus tenellus]